MKFVSEFVTDAPTSIQNPTLVKSADYPMLVYRCLFPVSGSAAQYLGQEEFYGGQYGHSQSSSEPINQQYYPDGNDMISHYSPSHIICGLFYVYVYFY